MKTQNKILISNSLALNAGDAAIVLAMVELLRQAFGPETRIIVYDSKPEIVSHYYPELEFRPWFYTRFGARCQNRYLRFLLRHLGRLRFRLGFQLWRRRSCRRLAELILCREELVDLRHYDSADLVVSAGGTYLVETYTLAPRIYDYRVTLALGRPLVLFTQSLGPFRKAGNRRALKDIFARANLVLLRDERSLRHVRELAGPDCRAEVSADAVFIFAEEETLTAAARQALASSRPLKVAVSVRDWPYFNELRACKPAYQKAIRAAVIHLVDKYDASVTFLSTCQGIPEYSQDDSRVAEDIVRGLPAGTRSRVKVSRHFHHPRKLLKQLKPFDLVIATRMHMAILALCVGVPALPIVLEFKTQELFARLGLEDQVVEVKTLTGPKLAAALDNFIKTFPTRRQECFRRVLEEKRQVLATVPGLRNALSNLKRDEQGQR